jgi:Protein of unknown function (DUF1670)
MSRTFEAVTGVLRRWLVDAYGTARLAAKDAESAIVARVCEDFNLSPVLARAHYEQRARCFAEYGQVPAQPGELCYLAVADDEPAGKPVAACRKVQVRLELTADEARRALAEHGLAAMRQRRPARLARQARVQQALLTVEDLAWLTVPRRRGSSATWPRCAEPASRSPPVGRYGTSARGCRTRPA